MFSKFILAGKEDIEEQWQRSQNFFPIRESPDNVLKNSGKVKS